MWLSSTSLASCHAKDFYEWAIFASIQVAEAYEEAFDGQFETGVSAGPTAKINHVLDESTRCAVNSSRGR